MECLELVLLLLGSHCIVLNKFIICDMKIKTQRDFNYSIFVWHMPNVKSCILGGVIPQKNTSWAVARWKTVWKKRTACLGEMLNMSQQAASSARGWPVVKGQASSSFRDMSDHIWSAVSRFSLPRTRKNPKTPNNPPFSLQKKREEKEETNKQKKDTDIL